MARPNAAERRRRRAAKNQAAQAPTGGEYGSRKEAMDAQAAIPLPDSAGSQRADMAAALAAAQQAPPPEGGLAAPSARPNEPVTAGLASGPGPGSSALRPMAGAGQGGVADIDMVRALYRQHPTEALRRVLERLDRTVGADRPPMPMAGARAMIPPTAGMSAGAAMGRQAGQMMAPDPQGRAGDRKGGRNAPPGGMFQTEDG